MPKYLTWVEERVSIVIYFQKPMQYVCLDSDLSKLEVSSKRNLDDDTVEGNATQIPNSKPNLTIWSF